MCPRRPNPVSSVAPCAPAYVQVHVHVFGMVMHSVHNVILSKKEDSHTEHASTDT